MRVILALAVIAAPLVAGCTSTDPAPHTSSASSSPSPSPASSSSPPPPGVTACVTSDPSGNCGPYDYAGIVNSNGFNTYVQNNCWGDPNCQQTITARTPGDWTVTATEPAGNLAVRTYPNIQEIMDNWSPDGTWSGAGTDTPIASLSKLTSTYTETTPHNAGTVAQAAWDIWTSNNAGHPNEIMVWVDNSNRGSGGAPKVGQATINGQQWTLYQNGSGELIWSLGAPGTFAQQGSGTVDLLALLRWLQANGHMAAGAATGMIQFGWEICSTGGVSKTFTVSSYDLKNTV